METLAGLGSLVPSFETETFQYNHVCVTICRATTVRGGQLIDKSGDARINDATGLMLWSGAHLLCYYLEWLGAAGRTLGTSLELGAGVGQCSAVALSTGVCSHLCATDGANPVLDLTAQNLGACTTAAPSLVSWVTRLLQWGHEVHIAECLATLPKEGRRFDTVFAAEVIYPDIDEPTLLSLFRTVDLALRPEGTFLCAFVQRSAASVWRMIETASLAGWVITMIPANTFLPEQQSAGRPLFNMQGAKLLRFARAPMGIADCNSKLGGQDCEIFPGLKASLERIRAAEVEGVPGWDPPFVDEDEIEKWQKSE